MPELPEVETTRRGIEPHLLGRRVRAVRVLERRLRWPIPDDLERALTGQRVRAVGRRAKYLLLDTAAGTAIAHLGMSGSLRIVAADTPLRKHDHVDIALSGGVHLRYHDPRRFGALLWTAEPPLRHPLLARLGPEPLTDEFCGDALYRSSRGRGVPVKTLIMDSRTVVGVGNIYASEALFLAGVRPQRAAAGVARTRYARLAGAIKKVLGDAIDQGGTTLRDFVNGDGEPGYFGQSLQVYGRAGEPCRACGSALKTLRIAQRSTFYCARCQR